MTGIKNPIAEFVVAPKIVMASPNVGRGIATAHETMTNINVQMAFCLVENF